MEFLLAALGSCSCLSVGYVANAAAMGIERNELRFKLDGDVDLRGFLGISEDVRPGYKAITSTAYIDADASEEELAELQDRVEATSPVLDTIMNAVPVETDVVAKNEVTN